MKDPKEFHSQRIEENRKEVQARKRVIGWFTAGRVFAFIGILAGAYFFWDAGREWFIPFTAIPLVLFFLLIRLQAAHQNRKEYHEEAMRIHRIDLRRCNGDLSPFDHGGEFQDQDHGFSYDLDIFQPGGAFQILDRTFSRGGRNRLAQRLTADPPSREDIRSTQEAVKELRDIPDERQDIRARGRSIGVEAEMEHPQENVLGVLPSNQGFYWFIRLFPILGVGTFLALLIGAISIQEFLYFLPLPVALLAWKGGEINKAFRSIDHLKAPLDGYGNVIEWLEEKDLRSGSLMSIKEKVMGEGKNATKRLRELGRILGSYESRGNPFVGIVLNILFLWDIQCMLKLEGWWKRDAERIPVWLEAVEELDMLNSLAGHAFDNPDHVFPSLENDKEVLEAKGMGHPMIPKDERVDNDLLMDAQGKFKIITGANMAGKSTFLRTVGINWVFASIGAVVCADEFRFRPMKLFSSMRTSDSLQRHESFFYSELKRLKAIMDHLREGKELFLLLDEILKGTNSEDKKKGSRRFLEKVLGLPASGIIATHDLDLCSLEEEYPDRIENLRFETEIKGDRSYFDYVLRKGVCKNMNATLLIERMGIG